MIPSTQWNSWQRVAAGTRGWLTPGNVVSFMGLAITLLGLGLIAGEVYAWGLAVIIAGRLCDILDGMFAEATGTKGPLGEMLDAGIDKLVTLSGLVVLVAINVLPWLAAVLVLAPNLVIAVVVYFAQRQQQRIHPSRIGKIAMASAWLGLFAFVATAASHGDISAIWRAGGYGLVGLSFLLGSWAAWGYARLLHAK